MQNPANGTEAMQAGPQNCPGIPGQPGTGPVPGEQAMGNEGGMPTGQAGPTGTGQADVQFQGMAQEMGAPGTNPAPPYMAAGGVQGGPQAAGTSPSAGGAASQEAPCACADTGAAQQGGHEGAYTYVHPQSGYPAGAPQGPAYPGPNPGVYGTGPAHAPGQMPGGPYPYGASGPQGMPPGMTGPQGISPGMAAPYGMPGMPPAGHPFPHPGPQFAGPGAAPMGYQQPHAYSQAPGQAPHVCDHDSDHGPGHPKHDAHQYGQFMGLVNDLANGNADASRVMAFLGSLENQFWKGALVGVSTTLLLTNDTVKNAIVGTLSNILGAFEKETEEEQSK